MRGLGIFLLVGALLLTGCAAFEPVPAGPVLVGDAPEASPTPTATPRPTPRAVPALEQGVEAGDAPFSGQVLHAEGAPLPSGLTVTLRGVAGPAGQPREVLVRSTALSPEGHFAFLGPLPVEPDTVYSASVVYQGVPFSAPVEAGGPLALLIYEPQEDPDLLHIEQLTLLLRQAPGALAVEQTLTLLALGERVYASAEPVRGGQRGGPLIPLPDQTVGLTLEGGALGGRFAAAPGGVYDMHVLLPGERARITARYMVADEDGLSLVLPYAADAVDVLVPQGHTLGAAGFTLQGEETQGGAVFARYFASNLAPGELALLLLTPEAQGRADAGLLLGAGVALGALLVLAGWISGIEDRRARRRAARAQRKLASPDGPAIVLLERMAALDARLSAGQIKQVDYDAERAALKADLVERLAPVLRLPWRAAGGEKEDA